jgi:hypothetical protein
LTSDWSVITLCHVEKREVIHQKETGERGQEC